MTYPDAITIEPRTSITTAGVPTYGAAVAYRANVQAKKVSYRTAQGEGQWVPGAMVFLPGRPAISIGARITHGSKVYEATSDGDSDQALDCPAPTLIYARLV